MLRNYLSDHICAQLIAGNVCIFPAITVCTFQVVFAVVFEKKLFLSLFLHRFPDVVVLKLAQFLMAEFSKTSLQIYARIVQQRFAMRTANLSYQLKYGKPEYLISI